MEWLFAFLEIKTQNHTSLWIFPSLSYSCIGLLTICLVYSVLILITGLIFDIFVVASFESWGEKLLLLRVTNFQLPARLKLLLDIVPISISEFSRLVEVIFDGFIFWECILLIGLCFFRPRWPWCFTFITDFVGCFDLLFDFVLERDVQILIRLFIKELSLLFFLFLGFILDRIFNHSENSPGKALNLSCIWRIIEFSLSDSFWSDILLAFISKD